MIDVRTYVSPYSKWLNIIKYIWANIMTDYNKVFENQAVYYFPFIYILTIT